MARSQPLDARRGLWRAGTPTRAGVPLRSGGRGLRIGAFVAAALLASLLGCSRPAPEQEQAEPGQNRSPSGAAASPARTPAARTRLVVFAASSLTDAFNDLERGFEAANPDADVVLSYAGSQMLALQINEGAPSDVFASADDAHMRALIASGRAEPSQTFAQNELIIVVPDDNPARIAELRDLPRAERLVIGASSVPVGVYTRELLARAAKVYGAGFEQSVLARVVSEESNVRLVRAKVELGEADAAVVYRTDAITLDAITLDATPSKATASKKVKQIALPAELNVRASYPMARLTKAAEPALAGRWMAYVLSPAGQAALAARGFLVDGGSVARGSP